MTKTRILLALAVIALIALAYNRMTAHHGTHMAAGPGMAEVTVPTLSGAALSGEAAFNSNCAACHGENAAGRQGMGPPLVHRIYEPSHHGDAAFVLAARQGVRQHHWDFGNMPAIDGVTDNDLANIITYVRTLQRANGIN